MGIDWKDLRFWLLVGFILFGAIGILVNELTWAEAGGVVAPVAVGYIGITAAQQLLTRWTDLRRE